MPELPEVETIVRDLRPALMGRIITGLMVGSACLEKMLQTPPRRFYEGIVMEQVQAVLRRGKYILIPLSNFNVIVLHLGMSGRLLITEVDPEEGDMIERFEEENPLNKHTHFALEFMESAGGNDIAVGFYDPRRFGRIWLAEDVQNIADLDIPGLRNLGTDALDLQLDQFSELLENRKRTVKSLLLDQTQIAGVGNIYADEACFVAKVHPARSVASLTRIEKSKLWFSIKTVLKEGIQHRGSSTSDYTSIRGDAGSYQKKHRVYGRKGHECVECAAPIERTLIAGRSTHYCPRCQKRGE